MLMQETKTMLSTPSGYTAIGSWPWGTKTLRKLNNSMHSKRIHLCWTIKKGTPFSCRSRFLHCILFHRLLLDKAKQTKKKQHKRRYCIWQSLWLQLTRSFHMTTLQGDKPLTHEVLNFKESQVFRTTEILLSKDSVWQI